LAAILIFFQIGSGFFESGLNALRIHLNHLGEDPPLPASFADLCRRVEQVEGVHFRELFERLPRDRAPDGDAALQ